MIINSRLELFPLTTHVDQAQLTIAGCRLSDLAQRFGTPLYLYDRATLDESARAYQQALATHYPASSAVVYAGKAGLSLALAQWTQTQQLWLDCTGAGELHIAQAASVPRERILVHGVNKTAEDLRAATQQAAIIVVDNMEELNRLYHIHQEQSSTLPDLWLRIRPGHAVDTHAYHQTGQADSKFGLDPVETIQAVTFCQQHQLPITGLHIHQGSNFSDPGPVEPGMDVILDLMAQLRDELDWIAQSFCPGGGWGVAYHEDELPHPSVDQYIAFVAGHLVAGCQQRNLPLPALYVEPGRTLVARAGVAIYQVGAVKETPQRHWLLLDGGMADNVRPALYGIRYSALPVQEPNRPNHKTAWLAGPYCESGDVLIEDLPLPDVQVGEFLAVPMSGAYQLGLGSNYNGACRPAVVWLESGEAQLIQRRETLADLVTRDYPLKDCSKPSQPTE